MILELNDLGIEVKYIANQTDFILGFVYFLGLISAATFSPILILLILYNPCFFILVSSALLPCSGL